MTKSLTITARIKLTGDVLQDTKIINDLTPSAENFQGALKYLGILEALEWNQESGMAHGLDGMDQPHPVVTEYNQAASSLGHIDDVSAAAYAKAHAEQNAQYVLQQRSNIKASALEAAIRAKRENSTAEDIIYVARLFIDFLTVE